MIKWKKHRINGTCAHGFSFGDIECSKYQLYFFLNKYYCGQTFECSYLLLQLSFTIKWKKKEKLSNRLTAAILKDFRFKNMECSASAHIYDR